MRKLKKELEDSSEHHISNSEAQGPKRRGLHRSGSWHERDLHDHDLHVHRPVLDHWKEHSERTERIDSLLGAALESGRDLYPDHDHDDASVWSEATSVRSGVAGSVAGDFDDEEDAPYWPFAPVVGDGESAPPL